MATILVTGASRGLGLELVKQLLDLPAATIDKVFAVTRSQPTPGLQELVNSSPDRLTNVMIEDLSDLSRATQASKDIEAVLQGRGLDILVNNAGTAVECPSGICSMTNQELLDVMNANVGSAHAVTTAFIPLLRKGGHRKVVNMSSALGSITRYDTYQWATTYSYKMSKAAMNMLTVQYALEFDKEDFTFIALSPGWIKTDLGGQNADIDLEVGGKAIRDIVLRSDRTDNGKFLCIRVPGWEGHKGMNQYDGLEMPW
ncbi:hypothetical protein M409DRAFT_30540 [Zasmidium cellare ATCC 36951]|uniref:Uncharacterized protein n=1 Tax=Zasmidium cellare ATCC 36951 TaxID=1080233 RepID=A0A6A6BVZ1_ZASCE|nr:uncharacterized protein M409DRAFT_30540 [Zasmidium cellare ATCC 36951]KAF2159004.1 hypothetical protein M409DRAFT_30540 [Zasmidium cellare ATCC 36951]